MGNKGNISEEAWAALSAIDERGGAVYLSMNRRMHVQINNTALRELLSLELVVVQNVGPGSCVEITGRGRALLAHRS